MNKNVCGPHVVVKLVKVLRKLDYDKDDQKQKLTLLMLAAMDKYDSIQNIPAVMVMKECCTLLLSISSDAKHHTRVANVAQQLLISSVPNFQYVALEIFSELIKKDKLQISRHQGLIVQALASADSVIADKSVFLIIKLANAENVQSVYELYAKVCKANEGASKAMRFGGHILTSCALRDVETAWFTSKLLELLSNDQGSESHSEDSLLKVVLRYISAEDSTESAVDLYQCLDRLVTQEETSCLDVFTIMLWLIHVHKTAFSERDSHIFSLIRSSCRRAKRPCNNILTFLSTVRALLVTSAVSIEDDDVRALKKLSTSSSNEAACYIYLQDIEHIMTSSFRPKLYESKDLREVCRNDLEQYMKRKIQAKQCRADPSMSLGKEKAPIQFQPESDTRVTSSSHEGTLLLGKSKHVWTAAGRVESNGDEVDEQSKSVDEAAPAELTVKPDDTSTETLANHIFSSLKHKD